MKNIIIIVVIIMSNKFLMGQEFNLRHIKTVTDNFPFLVSSVQVYDSSDEPIENLTSNNFSVSVDGNNCDSVNAQTYKESGLGFNIMLCLDLSGSMRGVPLRTMKDAILKFIDDMRGVDKLGLMGFADDAFLISDFSNDKDYLRGKIRNLTTSGNQTALYYGLYRGLSKLVENKDKAGKILIVIGDGKNESLSSSYTEDDVINLAKEEGIPVFSIGYTRIDRIYLQSFERISEKTGGKFYNSPTDNELTRQYEKLYSQILNIYLVTYLVVDVPGDGLEHTNVITVRRNNVSKTVSNKFISPAGVSAYKVEKKIIKETIPLWYYYLAGGLVIFIAGITLILYTINKKKKAELKRIREEEEKKRNEEIEAEKKKRLELEKQLEENKKIPAPETVPKIKNETEKTVMIKDTGQEKTIIITPGMGGNTLRLEILTGINQGSRFDVTNSGATIGRSENNTIIIKEDTISSNHAKIVFSNGQFYIEDLGSSNGTFINGKNITSTVVNHGDVFKFGKCEGSISIF